MSKKNRPPKSNRAKRAELDAKREKRRRANETAQMRKLAAAGRLANGVVMPEGAIAAVLEQQAPNNSYSPPLYYINQPFTCVDCGKQEVWTATQQKWYYEVAKGSIYGRANRCRPCRRKRREARQNP